MEATMENVDLMQDAALREALHLLGVYTAGRFDIYGLAGPSRASCRAHVMATLLGLPKVPQSKCGINALREEFYRRMIIRGECGAVRETTFKTAARGLRID